MSGAVAVLLGGGCSFTFRLNHSGLHADDSGMNDEIRDVLRTHAHLRVNVDTLPEDADLFAAGMTSHASIGVMLAIEKRFDIEFPDNMLKRGVFESIASIEEAVTEILSQQPA